MNTLTKIRKVCNNCKMNALFTNRVYLNQAVNYGGTTTGSKLYCDNCGHEGTK